MRMTRTQEIINERRQADNLARAIREGTRPRAYAFGTEYNPETAAEVAAQTRSAIQSIKAFNAHTREKALLLAASRRLRRLYFWGSTFSIVVLSPAIIFGTALFAKHFGQSLWWLVPIIIGAVVVPLYALRGYFIWIRSHWYRWIAKGIKQDYDDGKLI